jgi:hypothetical protein
LEINKGEYMNFLDRLAFNRLVAIVLNFIITLIKIFSPKTGKELEDKYPTPPIPRPPKWKPNLPRPDRLKPRKLENDE